MTRSKWKKNYVPFFLRRKVKDLNEDFIKIWTRSAVIEDYCIGKTFLIHNGKDFIPVLINQNMVGHKFGEFAFSRKKSGNRK